MVKVDFNYSYSTIIGINMFFFSYIFYTLQSLSIKLVLIF